MIKSVHVESGHLTSTDSSLGGPIPRLYGLSLLGTSLRVYCADKAAHKITPDFVRNPGMDIIPSDFLQGQWNLDILSPDGLTKMQEIIGYIKAEVEAANVGQ